jgi:hypothetical protein
MDQRPGSPSGASGQCPTIRTPCAEGRQGSTDGLPGGSAARACLAGRTASIPLARVKDLSKHLRGLKFRLSSRSGDSRHNPIEQALEGIENDNPRKAIGHRLDLASRAVLFMVLLRSPLLMVLSMLFLVAFLLGWYLGGQIIATKVRRYIHKLKRNVQVEAIESKAFQG